MRKKYLLLIFLLFLFSCATTSQEVSTGSVKKDIDIVESYNAALLAMSLNDYQRAITLFNKCLKYNYNSDFSNLYIGIAYYKLKKYSNAIKHLKRALEINPELTEAHNTLGAVFAEEKKYDLALNEFFKVLEDKAYLFPENALYNIALIYYNKGEYLKSIEYCKKTLIVVPKSPMVYYLLGLNYFKLGRPEITKRYMLNIITNFKKTNWAILAKKFIEDNKL